MGAQVLGPGKSCGSPALFRQSSNLIGAWFPDDFLFSPRHRERKGLSMVTLLVTESGQNSKPLVLPASVLPIAHSLAGMGWRPLSWGCWEGGSREAEGVKHTHIMKMEHKETEDVLEILQHENNHIIGASRRKAPWNSQSIPFRFSCVRRYLGGGSHLLFHSLSHLTAGCLPQNFNWLGGPHA